MVEGRTEDLDETLERAFPSPTRFSRLKIFRSESVPSLAVTLLLAVVLLIVFIAARTVMISGETSIPSVAVQSVSLASNEREALDLTETETVPEIEEATSATPTEPVERVRTETVEQPTGSLDEKRLETSPAAEAATREATDAINKSLKRLAQLRSVPSSPGSPAAATPAPGTDQAPVASLTGPPSEGKVTKGSFTVWTVPDDPVPGMNYAIAIQIRWPKRVRRVKVFDLSGRVIGTDGWNQALPLHPNVPSYALKQGQLVPLGPTSYIPIKGRTSRLIIWVPGANQLVRDRISIRSNALKENQTLEITF